MNKSPVVTERLQKVIANRGFCARRAAEKLILTGAVAVNGTVITTLGVKIDPAACITINGQNLELEQKKVYLAFNKPSHCVATAKDPQQRKTVLSYFTTCKERVYPIGRLDFDTTGLLLLTNDGDFAYTIAHPKFEIDKVYRVWCTGLISEQQINQLERGVMLANEFQAAPAQVNNIVLQKAHNSTRLDLTIHEGHKHQVKKMIKAIGSTVFKLERIAIGSLTLEGIALGSYRHLTAIEVATLLAETQKK